MERKNLKTRTCSATPHALNWLANASTGSPRIKVLKVRCGTSLPKRDTRESILRQLLFVVLKNSRLQHSLKYFAERSISYAARFGVLPLCLRSSLRLLRHTGTSGCVCDGLRLFLCVSAPPFSRILAHRSSPMAYE